MLKLSRSAPSYVQQKNTRAYPRVPPREHDGGITNSSKFTIEITPKSSLTNSLIIGILVGVGNL